MAREPIYKGDDKVIRVTMTDSDGLTPIDLADLEGYIAILYYRVGNLVIKKWSKNPLTGYSGITEVTPASGIFDVYLEAVDTKGLNEGDVDLEVKIQTENSAFDNDTFHTIARGVVVGAIKEAISKNVTSL